LAAEEALMTSFPVHALYSYSSWDGVDLNFDEGQIIGITEQRDKDWWFGEYINDAGDKKRV
jgi:hypothetical protein